MIAGAAQSVRNRLRAIRPITLRSVRTIISVLFALVAGGFIADRYILSTKADYYLVTPRIIALEINGPGLLDAINKVVITAKIQGFLRFIGADKNQVVKQGQVLAILESVDLRNQLAAAQAQAQAAKSAVSEAESERDRTSAALDKAKTDFERRKELFNLKVATAAQFSDAEAALKDAQANFARATTAIDRAKAQLASNEANVDVIKARLADATLNSPINGVVVSRERNVGDLLMPGTSLMTVVDTDSIIVSARFDESTMSAIRSGQHVKVTFASNPSQIYNGYIFRLTRQVDLETREFTADVKLNTLPDDWALGQRANVTVEARSPNQVIAVPLKFISREDGQVGVWVEQGMRAYWKRVSLGYLSGSDVEVSYGLKTGDVVLDPHARYPYQSVSLNKAVE